MLKVYWTIAIVSSIVFVIQMVLTFVGIGDADADGGVDLPDTDVAVSDGNGDTLDTGGAIQLFTVRNLVNFLLGIGWAGVCLWDLIPIRPLLAGAAILCGCLMVAAFLVMFRQVMKLQGNGAIRIDSYVGVSCSVYLRIPARRQGQGKVQISLHGSVQEIDAQTDGAEMASGSRARVVSVIDSHTLLVEPLT